MKKILSATISLLLFALAGGEPAADVPLNSSGELQFGDARFRIAVFGSTWHENNNRQWRELNVTELPSGRELSAVLDVDVDTDRTAPWLAAFQARGFKTEVHLEGTSGTPVLTVLGYMRTKDVEDKAFAEVSYELSADSVDVKRRIVHESDVKPLLDRAIKEQGLEDVTVEWHPGRITLSAPLSPKTRNMLTAAMQQVGRTVHVPLSYELLHREARKTAAKAPARRSAPKDSMTPNFRVVGVSGGKLKFVTLSTGEKVFTGGRLPGGFTLESISHNRLTLSKSGKRINYPLKVSSK